MDQKVVLVTGASSGIGQVCADYLHNRGYKVYGASRSVKPQSRSYVTLQMNVNGDDSVAGCIRQIVDKELRIDVVVNCAGFGIAGAVEETSIEEAKAQFETNFFGVVRVCAATLPIMRQQQSGLIINISSIGGLISLPFQAFYSASKFALEAMTEALRMEVAPFGIRVVLVEPGDFQTQFTANRKLTAESQDNSSYRERFQRVLTVIENEENNGADPSCISRLIEHLIRNPSPRLRYSIGPASERIAPLVKQILPHKLYEWLLVKHYDAL